MYLQILPVYVYLVSVSFHVYRIYCVCVCVYGLLLHMMNVTGGFFVHLYYVNRELWLTLITTYLIVLLVYVIIYYSYSFHNEYTYNIKNIHILFTSISLLKQ